MTGTALKLNSLNGALNKKYSGPKMPALFIGHGSPMNALADNNFTKSLEQLGKKIATPNAILCISAHWMTEGTWVTGMERPKTIHDFYGFPQALFDVQYPALGSLEIANQITTNVSDPKINIDQEIWGLDHGTWSVLRHMYPNADVLVLQLSIDLSQPPEYHFKLGQELAKLRDKGVLIVGSGNIVHNLRKLNWDENARPFDWAIEFDQWVKDKIIKRDFNPLQSDFLKSESGKLSIPTPDHYYPLLYTLGASNSSDEMQFEYEEIQNASISMRCVSFS